MRADGNVLDLHKFASNALGGKSAQTTWSRPRTRREVAEGSRIRACCVPSALIELEPDPPHIVVSRVWRAQQLFREPLGAIPDTIAPQGNEIVITKHRIGVFAGTDLAMIL